MTRPIVTPPSALFKEELHYVDSSPDAEYPIRILQTHLEAVEAGEWVGSGGGEFAAEAINNANKERAKILRKAIEVLEAGK